MPVTRMRAGGIRAQLLAGIALLMVVLFVGIRWRGNDIQDEPPVMSGQLWAADVDGAPVLVYITREERAKSVPLMSRSRSWRSEPYSRFDLVVRRVTDGSVASSLRLADVKSAVDANAPRILGIVGEIVWLWRDGLEARNVKDLVVRATAATLAGGGPESASDVLPAEPKGFAVAPDPARLVARGRDARFYVVDAVTTAVTAIDPAELPATTFSTRVEDRFHYLIPPGRSRVFTHPYDIMQRSFLTSTGQWYALMSESERTGQSRWPSGEARPSGDVARSLYRTTYRLDDRRVPEIDPASLTPVGVERLIQAGFIVRWQGRVWDVAEPSSSLVLTKQSLGDAEPWQVVRLARDGSVVWRTSTELSEPRELVDLGTHIAFLGRDPAPPTGSRHDRLVWIHLRTGARGSLSVASGDIR